jgi:hypothetical protein
VVEPVNIRILDRQTVNQPTRQSSGRTSQYQDREAVPRLGAQRLLQWILVYWYSYKSLVRITFHLFAAHANTKQANDGVASVGGIHEACTQAFWNNVDLIQKRPFQKRLTQQQSSQKHETCPPSPRFILPRKFLRTATIRLYPTRHSRLLLTLRSAACRTWMSLTQRTVHWPVLLVSSQQPPKAYLSMNEPRHW